MLTALAGLLASPSVHLEANNEPTDSVVVPLPELANLIELITLRMLVAHDSDAFDRLESSAMFRDKKYGDTVQKELDPHLTDFFESVGRSDLNDFTREFQKLVWG
jgi:hypothetical protein